MKTIITGVATLILAACGPDLGTVRIDAGSATDGYNAGGECWYVVPYNSEKPSCDHSACCTQIGDSGVGHCCIGDDAGV